MQGAVSLSWGEVFTFIGLVLTFSGLIATVFFKVSGHIRSVKEDLEAHKLDVAQRYVQSENLNSMKEDLIRSEARMLGAIGALTERLDRFLTRQQDGNS